MTYNAILDWMFKQLPAYQQKGKTAINAKLDNILRFAAYLHHPEQKFKSIHVGGTNGKGSSSHMLASILQEAGYNVGLYTSPHLKDFRERIRINGTMIDKKHVINFIEKNRNFFEENKLSFFEMTVGMAFDYFAKKKVDIAIIEVGLGGRYDSTNIINPEVSLITNIGYDHTDILGNTLREIAFEKAGIIKFNTPLVISECQEEVKSVFEKVAFKKKSELVFADKTIDKVFKTDLLGHYQVKNSKGVIAVLKELKSFKITKKHIENGLLNVAQNTGLMGRWQALGEAPKIICDTAHNAEGISLVVAQIYKQKFNRLHIVLGFVKSKDLDAILPLFPKDADYYFCKPNIERGLDVSVLVDKAFDFHLRGESYDSVDSALKVAKEKATEKDFIFVGGSNFVVAEVI